MTSEFNRFFSSKTLASTYKPTFVKCLLDLGDFQKDEGEQWVKKHEDYLTVDLNFIAVRFLRYYHPLKFKFKLKQEATAKRIVIYRILEDFKELVGIKTAPSKKTLCSEHFSEMRQKTIKEGIKPQVLKKLLNDCNIYSINKGPNSIEIKTDVVKFMKENKKVLESALNHMIAKYLENCNASPNISTALEEIIPRKKLSVPIFDTIIDLQSSRCFYCNQKFDRKEFAQEHFIPWNFIRQTEPYNIIAACTPCNSSENDRLASEKYLENIIKRNKTLEKLPMGYSEEFMRNMYGMCRIEYHGISEKLWEL